MRIRVSRRQIAVGLLAIVGGGTAAYWAGRREDSTPLDLELPAAGNPFAATFGEFFALSQIVLLRSELNERGARRLYEVFLEEPWAGKHIGHAYKLLREELIKHYRNVGDRGPVDFSRLETGERWFVDHLVTTWYLGVYYHQERPTRRILYEEALMFDAIRGTMPIPFLESTGFGAWAEPPSTDD